MCKHCQYTIGSIRNQVVSSSAIRWTRLAFAKRKNMIQYAANGDVTIRVICKNCEDILMDNPHYHTMDYFIH